VLAALVRRPGLDLVLEQLDLVLQLVAAEVEAVLQGHRPVLEADRGVLGLLQGPHRQADPVDHLRDEVLDAPERVIGDALTDEQGPQLRLVVERRGEPPEHHLRITQVRCAGLDVIVGFLQELAALLGAGDGHSHPLDVDLQSFEAQEQQVGDGSGHRSPPKEI
jgi:hypothetical protein